LAALIALGFTRIGRAMAAMRQDEIAAAAMGIDLMRYKLVALAASAALAGLAGAFEAHSTTFIAPGEFGFDAAVTILSYALLGGVDSPLGPVLGAVILTLLPELLRPLQDFRLAMNGLIIVLAVLFMPRGLLPWRVGRIG
jgi:branched-chain amino acid transport system permease protein